ncbi:integrase core domain-containing protein [Streptomyces sp. NWU339]|uniref:integrase core domain-containing protein n=1 Tax=Streptomyces sp. NWU339 TaxID=2185284 RepID=UPI0015E7FD55|nr:integrase core domain-containing protein [Streptomyces sp. NWU339]
MRTADRGAEYTSREYRSPLRKLEMRQSMGRTGSCCDNAAAESFFGLLKAEIGTTIRESRKAARADVFRFIEVEYNRTRLRKHPVYGYVTPLETRALTTQDLAPHRNHPLSTIRGSFSLTPGRPAGHRSLTLLRTATAMLPRRPHCPFGLHSIAIQCSGGVPVAGQREVEAAEDQAEGGQVAVQRGLDGGLGL